MRLSEFEAVALAVLTSLHLQIVSIKHLTAARLVRPKLNVHVAHTYSVALE
jgi:hypothetical protein